MMRRLLLLLAVATSLSGCTGPVILGSGAAAIILTRPSSGDTADTKDQIPPHESWCYQTMGEAECYAHPQDVPPGRLINVDPPNLYPVDLTAYHQALLGTPVVASGEPVIVLPAAPDVEVEKRNLSDEISSGSPTGEVKTP